MHDWTAIGITTPDWTNWPSFVLLLGFRAACLQLLTGHRGQHRSPVDAFKHMTAMQPEQRPQLAATAAGQARLVSRVKGRIIIPAMDPFIKKGLKNKKK